MSASSGSALPASSISSRWRIAFRRRPCSRGAAGGQVSRLGRHSLVVFALGSILGALGQAILPIAEIHNTYAVVATIGILYTLASIGGLFLLARLLEWRDPDLGGSARAFSRVTHGFSHSA